MARQRQKINKVQQQEKAKNSSESGNAQSQLFGVLFGVGILVVVTLAVYFFIIDIPQPLEELEVSDSLENVADNSVVYEDAGNAHIADDEPREYNSNPPTSGPHNARWVRPLGTFTEQLNDTYLIHNLEHGHVWLSYRDEGDEAVIEALSALQEQYSDRVIVTYRPENDSRIAVAAWTRLLTLEEVDSTQIEAFIVRHSDNAPESIMEGR